MASDDERSFLSKVIGAGAFDPALLHSQEKIFDVLSLAVKGASVTCSSYPQAHVHQFPVWALGRNATDIGGMDDEGRRFACRAVQYQRKVACKRVCLFRTQNWRNNVDMALGAFKPYGDHRATLPRDQQCDPKTLEAPPRAATID